MLALWEDTGLGKEAMEDSSCITKQLCRMWTGSNLSSGIWTLMKGLLCGYQAAASELWVILCGQKMGVCPQNFNCFYYFHCWIYLGSFHLYSLCSLCCIFQHDSGPVLSDGSLAIGHTAIFISSNSLTSIISLIWLLVLPGRGTVSSCLQGRITEWGGLPWCSCIT